MTSEFQKLLKQHRKMSQRDLARAAGISPAYLSGLEKGHKIAPSRNVVINLADAMKLSFEVRNEFLKAAGHVSIASRPKAAEEMGKLLASLRLDEREAAMLIGDLRAYAQRWAKLRQSRDEALTTVVLPNAGWEARLVPPEQRSRMLEPGVREALRAGFKKLIVITAPASEASLDSTRSLAAKGSAEVKIVTQREPNGLGGAILCAQDAIGSAPFGVLLPVDIDPAGEALLRLVESFSRYKKPFIAVNPVDVSRAAQAELRSYGAAVLDGTPKTRLTQRVYQVGSMQEKGADANVGVAIRMIVGRYILVPEIFDFLKRLTPSKSTGKIELTDALDQFRRDNHFVYAYELSSPLLSLAVVRAMMTRLIGAIGDAKALAAMNPIMRNALKALADIPSSGTLR